MFSHRMKHLFFREQVWIALIFFAKLIDVDQNKVLICQRHSSVDLWPHIRVVGPGARNLRRHPGCLSFCPAVIC